MRLADTNVLIYAVSNREADVAKRARAEETVVKKVDFSNTAPSTFPENAG